MRINVFGKEPGLTREGERPPVYQFSIDMARHSIKGPKPREALTEEGMEAAVKSRLEDKYSFLGKIFGSPRERTGQSSVLRKYSQQLKDVNFANTDPEEIVRWLQEGGLEKQETPLLDFSLGEGDYNKEFMENFNAKRLLKWKVEASDKRVLETKQDPHKVSSLSLEAANVASFIFAEIGDAYDRLAKGETAIKGMERVDFATSHQGVIESFLYKVIFKKEGKQAADQFVADLNNQGFKENQGIKLDIAIYDKNKVDDWKITLHWKDQKIVVTPKEILEIFREGDELKEKLEKARKEK